MSNTRDLLDFVAPEFEDLADGVKDQAIAFAGQRISAEAFGRLYQQAIAYLAAHILASARGDVSSGEAGAIGQITSIRTGDLQIGGQALAGVEGANASLASTSYGQRYLEIKNKIPGGPLLG